jgi:membrane-associated phospholipid phosphatase
MREWRRARELDRRLMREVVRGRSPAWDRALVRVGRAANYSRLWLLVAGALALLGGPRGRRASRRGVVAVAIAAAVANGPAKLFVRRRRPERFGPTLIRMPRSSSFPSGHSASAFAFATGACAECPALTPWLLPLAGTVAFSRVRTGVHYPSDVLAGLGVGVASGLLAGRWVSGRHPPRVTPAHP